MRMIPPLLMMATLLGGCGLRYTADSDIPDILDINLQTAEFDELDRAEAAMDDYWAKVCEPLLLSDESPYAAGWNAALRSYRNQSDGIICSFLGPEISQFKAGEAAAIPAITQRDPDFIPTLERFRRIKDKVLSSSQYRLMK